MSKVIIVSNGCMENYRFYYDKINKDDYIICVDGAIHHLKELNILPNLWIGDFDSCNFEDVIGEWQELRKVETIRLNCKKNETDTHFALISAIKRGYKEVVIWGGLGKRFDHSISNIHLLEFAYNCGINAYIEDEKNTIHLFDNKYTLKKGKKYLSLVPLDKSVNVVETYGLMYPLKEYSMDRCLSIGISNEIVDDEAYVIVSGGLMLAVESDD